MTRRLPKYVSEFRDRHGKLRVRFRKKGCADHYFKAAPWTPAFMAEYQSCLDGKLSAPTEIGADRTAPGTMDALIVAYYGAPEFRRLSDASKKTYRSILERFRADHGKKRVTKLERRHIKTMIGALEGTPAAANNLLDRIKVLMAFAVEIGMRKDNPALGLKGFSTRSEGFHTWSEDEIAAFQTHHAEDSRALLALALLLHTGQRRSDVVRMGWHDVADGGIVVRQQKTGTRLWLPMTRELAALVAPVPRGAKAFLTTWRGLPFTVNGFGNYFRDMCTEAGLPHCSAHGLRKAAARRLAEAGCSNQEIKAITGHRTDAEVSRYTAAASQTRLARQAIESLAEQLPSTPSNGLDRNADNRLTDKDDSDAGGGGGIRHHSAV